MDPDRRWAALEADWLARPGITAKKMLSAPGLAAANGKVFAFPTGGRLTVKLPEGRVDELVASGRAERMRAGGRGPMREWAWVEATDAADWPGLVEEAHRFVG